MSVQPAEVEDDAVIITADAGVNVGRRGRAVGRRGLVRAGRDVRHSRAGRRDADPERRRVRQRGRRRDHRLTVLDRKTGAVATWDPTACGFGFRTSAFKHTDRYVVLDVTIPAGAARRCAAGPLPRTGPRLGRRTGRAAPSTDVREVVLGLRRSKGMVLDAAITTRGASARSSSTRSSTPSQVPDGLPALGGRRPVKLSAAWLIEKAGFGKGYGLDAAPARSPSRPSTPWR